MAAAARSSAVFKRAASTAAQVLRHQNFSSAAAAADIHRPGDFYCDDSEGEESAVYQHTLKFQRPSTIKQHQLLHNSVSLIGKIDYPFKRVNTKNGSFGVHTLLSVSGSSQSRSSFKVMLKMWDEMAEVSMEHLKSNDLVYVWGHLGSYIKTDENGKHKMRYQVYVKEINFVTPDVQALATPEFQKKESRGFGDPVFYSSLAPYDHYIWLIIGTNGILRHELNYELARKILQQFAALDDVLNHLTLFLALNQNAWLPSEDELENYRNRIQLWQIFLASPFEWMDFRKSKINPKYPDFKNRDTGEVLWLRTDDPPWIKRQLDILDSRFSYESF
ncbi:hypothetical protein MTR67_020886 [Solanum verrucosum]|uniref:Uncharacterized protein n=1 Tax=Solanum verrucosum TaxID=315347 RepID=A0AAF0TPK2_SOLVR|nr:hypothetical protein MTR67_020886 [Solanum verrucosum]